MRLSAVLSVAVLSFACCVSCNAWSLPEKLFGSWHCAQDACLWATEPDLSDSKWMVDRGDGVPTFNVVILSFVNPLFLLHQTTDSANINGAPRGMTHNVVDFFQSRNITVMFSIGGITYVKYWEEALQEDAAKLAFNAANLSSTYNVGIEIDFESNDETYLSLMDTFVENYRNYKPLDGAPTQPGDLLTCDVGAGTRYLTHMSQHCANWMENGDVNWENAMVANQPYHFPSNAESNWNEHLSGYLKVTPTPPNQLTGGMWESHRNYNCNTDPSVASQLVPWVEEQGMLGLFFWAAGCQSSYDCVGGAGCPGIIEASKEFLG